MQAQPEGNPEQRPRNRLLAALSPEAYAPLAPRLERAPLQTKQSLLEPEEIIEHVYFPEVGVCSMVMTTDTGIVEVATVGREGMVGTPVLLATDRSPAKVFCQVPGAALRLRVEHLQDEIQRNPAFYRILLRYTQMLINQISHSATCNRAHNVEERAARWLLMTHDRVDGDRFPLTQEFLGQMLGVRRQAVNIAAGMLQQAGLITYVRGVITILDRPGLEGASCECYPLLRREFDQLLG